MVDIRTPDPLAGRRGPEKGQNRPSGGLGPGFEGRAASGAASARSGAVSGLPDSGRLLHLVERAERGVLTHAEAGLLRVGVERLLQAAEARDRSRGEVRGLLLGWAEEYAPQVRVRDVDGLVARLVPAAPVALETRVGSTSGSPALAIGCPKCGAEPWVWCRPVSGVMPPRLHAGRRRLAGELS